MPALSAWLEDQCVYNYRGIFVAVFATANGHRGVLRTVSPVFPTSGRWSGTFHAAGGGGEYRYRPCRRSAKSIFQRDHRLRQWTDSTSRRRPREGAFDRRLHPIRPQRGWQLHAWNVRRRARGSTSTQGCRSSSAITRRTAHPRSIRATWRGRRGVPLTTDACFPFARMTLRIREPPLPTAAVADLRVTIVHRLTKDSATAIGHRKPTTRPCSVISRPPLFSWRAIAAGSSRR